MQRNRTKSHGILVSHHTKNRTKFSSQLSANDWRIRIVSLTKQGRAFISELYKRHAADLETITDVLNEKEQDQLRTLLKSSASCCVSHFTSSRSSPSMITI
jgi:hypothetical protein